MKAREFFASLPERAGAAGNRLDGVDRSYLFDVTGEGRWLVEVRDGTVNVTGDATGPADVTFKMTKETFERIQARKQNPMVAYMKGKLKVSGDIRAAMALQAIL